MLIATAGPVHDLILNHLSRAPFTLVTQLDPEFARGAVAMHGGVLDHLSGEQPLAFSDISYAGRFESWALVTDRRVLGYLGHDRFDIRYGDVAHLDAATDGWGVTRLLAEMSDGSRQNASAPDWGTTLAPFLKSVCALPAERREPAPTSLRPLVSEADPSGAEAATRTMGVDHPWTRTMLHYLFVKTERGEMSVPEAQAHVHRIVLAHRTLAYGRGTAGGMLLSPLSKVDLDHVITELAGEPIKRLRRGGARLFKSPQNGYGRGKLAVNAIGLALAAAGTGVIVKSNAHVPDQVKRFCVSSEDDPLGCRFRLLGPKAKRPLAGQDGPLMARLDAGLRASEQALMMRRCVMGSAAMPQALVSVPKERPLAQIAAALGEVDASAFV